MRVLLTGGTGVIGEGVIPALLAEGHEVRLLTRGAERGAREWPRGVEPFAADVSDARTLTGAAADCDAVVHVTGIVSESPPEVTFERVNVGGTRNILKEAQRAGVRRFVFVSSLGADRGQSDYHRSKLKGEELVRKFRGDWVILRPGAVYGPGDEVVSVLLKLVRALPVVPAVGDAEQRFQPVWYEDFGAAVARAVADETPSRETFEVAGDDLTTTRDIVERMGRLTGREPTLLPVPELLATTVARASDALGLGRITSSVLGVDLSVDEAKVTMLVEENFIREPSRNALTEVFGVEPLPLDEGLRLLADTLPEQLPSEGFGPLRRKRFRAEIVNSRLDAPGLLKLFRERCSDIMPIEFDAEPDTPNRVERGVTLTAALPARGNIQMRVAEAGRARVTFVTIEGHPLAGVVVFTTEKTTRGVRFTVETLARAANAFDYVGMSTVGSVMQDANWVEVVERMVEESGGSAPKGVEQDDATLDEEEAAGVERRIERLVVGLRRAENVRKEAAAKGTKKGATKSVKRRDAAGGVKRPAARKATAKGAVVMKAATKAKGTATKRTTTKKIATAGAPKAARKRR
ncbi:MAG TPA: NAD-dependent epimerase/dehydratase family protein [Pyrinomonadaceae bacterium]|nr:NAD-dependent epimerase/dehydratase family protein [Pyrinomonadaceae bacterium]